jgi:2-C-methyl-D-erythritol 2,4-cyclodiphosphate synthase
LTEAADRGEPAGGRPDEPGARSGAPFRVGFGYDSHRFDPSRPCILGGVSIPDTPGLAGHSDADAVAHALTDALLGAVADGDIGLHFPPTDPAWKGADSLALLARVVARLGARGWTVGNVDLTVICERPKIGPVAPAMRHRLAQVLQVDEDAVSIKGKTNETMGWEGRSEGVAVHAVALVYQRPA